MNPREDNVWIPDDTYYCKLIGRLVDNILYLSFSVCRLIHHCSLYLSLLVAKKESWAFGVLKQYTADTTSLPQFLLALKANIHYFNCS